MSMSFVVCLVSLFQYAFDHLLLRRRGGKIGVFVIVVERLRLFGIVNTEHTALHPTPWIFSTVSD